MLMEIMGLHLPGAAFVHPHDDLRHALTVAATDRMVTLAKDTAAKGIGEMLDERSFVKGKPKGRNTPAEQSSEKPPQQKVK